MQKFLKICWKKAIKIYNWQIFIKSGQKWLTMVKMTDILNVQI